MTADVVAVVVSGFAVGFSGCAVWYAKRAQRAAERAARRTASAAEWIDQDNAPRWADFKKEAKP